MPQSYITGGLSTPDAENKKILLVAEPKIDELAQQIKAGEKIPEEPLENRGCPVGAIEYGKKTIGKPKYYLEK